MKQTLNLIQKSILAMNRWYNGKHIENDLNSPVVFLGVYERHWTANLARRVVKYWKREYKFIVSTAFAVIGVLLTLIYAK